MRQQEPKLEMISVEGLWLDNMVRCELWYFWFYLCLIGYAIFCHRSFGVISTSWSKIQYTKIKTRFYIICCQAENLLIRCSVYGELQVTGEYKGPLLKSDIKSHSPCVLWSHSHSLCLEGVKGNCKLDLCVIQKERSIETFRNIISVTYKSWGVL